MQQTLRLHLWFTHELRRWLSSALFWFFVIFSPYSIVISTYGNMTISKQEAADGVIDAASLTESLLSLPYAGVLFTTLLGIGIMARDFDSKFSNRLFMLDKTCVSLIVVKSLVAIILSIVVGVVTLFVGYITTKIMLGNEGIDFLPQQSLFEWISGNTAVYVLGAIWGISIALLLRSTWIAMGTHIIYQIIIESLIIEAFPAIGKWLPGGAQLAIVQDPYTPERLDVLPGLGIYVLWLVVIFAISIFVFRRFPEPPSWNFKRAKAQ